MRADLQAPISIVAILRGIAPEQCVEVSELLYRAGIRIIEVPLNSPEPFESIRRLRASLNPDCMVGAGTVMSTREAHLVREAGGQLIVSPNVDAEVIRCGLQLDLEVMPGFATATEAFRAIHTGAKWLKLFPAATYGPQHLKALKAVLPEHVRVFPVGGIGASQIASWLAVGADGFGFGSELYSPKYGLSEIEHRARQVSEALRKAQEP